MILSTIVEFIEFGIITLIGHFMLKVSYDKIIVILLTFFISRFTVKMLGYRNGHYKIVTYFDMGWVRCFTWTSMLCFSCFLSTYLNINVAMLFTIFTAIVISNASDVDELKLGKKSLYNDVYFWCRRNKNSKKLLDFEEKLKENEELYEIYMDLFVGGLTQEEVAFNLGYNYTSYLERQITRIIGRLETEIYEIYLITNNR